MTTAPYPQLTDELLSAYIDEAVSEDERRLIESAVAHDPQIAWRLESLRATVRLLHELPALALPRSFVLAPEQVNATAPGTMRGPASGVAPNGAPVQTRGETNQRRQAEAATGGGFWQELWRGWGQFWQAGSPALRNAMAASFAVLLALLIAPRFLAPPALPGVGSVQTAAAPASDPAAVMSSAEAGNTSAQSDQIAAAVAPTLAVQVEPDAGTARQAPGAAQPEAASETTTDTSTDTSTAPKLANTGDAEPVSASGGAAASTAAEMAADTGAFAAPAGVAASVAAPAPGQPAPVLEEGAPAMEGAGSGGRSAIDDMQMAGGGGGAPQAPEAAPPGAAAAQPAVPASAKAVPAEAVTGVAMESAAAEAPAPTQAAALAAADAVQPMQAEATAATEESLQAEAAPALDAAPPIAASQPVEAQSAPAEAAEAAAPVTSATEPVLAAGLALALPVFALLAAAATLIFAALWWRSRSAR